MNIYTGSPNVDGSAKQVNMPTHVDRVIGIWVDPGTTDTTITIGNESVVVSAAGGPGPFPLADGACLDGIVTIASAAADSAILIVAE